MGLCNGKRVKWDSGTEKKNDNKFKGWFDFFCWYIFFEINKIYRGEMLNADWMWIQTQIKNQK